MMLRTAKIAVLAAALSLSCGKRDEEKATETPDVTAEDKAPEPAAEEGELERAQQGASKPSVASPAKDLGLDSDEAKVSGPRGGKLAKKNESGRGGANAGLLGGQESGVRSRSWFPETFLFEPLVATDATGKASVDVTVPDRLTSWRVLALAHSRSGSQAGAVTEFIGTLPVYVDPIVPPQLRVGDKARLPVQLVNTTSKPVTTELTMTVSGGRLEAPPRKINVPSSGSAIVYANIEATEAGKLELVATLGGVDSVVRRAEVIPVGKRIESSKNATLAAPRTLALAAAGDGRTLADRVRLEVYPGALAILRSELGASSSRPGIAADAFSLLLAGRAPALLAKLGDEANGDALRTMTILATQRIVRHARTLTPESATLLAQAALAHPQNAILSALGRRAVAFLETTQLPDGTCGGENGWTLQRLLVATADCARAAADSRAVVARASGAFERHGKQITDPFTAAAILAADGAPDSVFAARLEKTILEFVERGENGAASIRIPDGVVRADGARPSTIEATALAALAQKDVATHKKLVADFGATVLAGYSRRRGWGDGRANLVATEALVELFSEPIPENVTIELSRGDELIASGSPRRTFATFFRSRRGTSASARALAGASKPSRPFLGSALISSSRVGCHGPSKTARSVLRSLLLHLPSSASAGRRAGKSRQPFRHRKRSR